MSNESWGDMVRSVDAERKALPWKADDFSRSSTMSLAEVSYYDDVTSVLSISS